MCRSRIDYCVLWILWPFLLMCGFCVPVGAQQSTSGDAEIIDLGVLPGNPDGRLGFSEGWAINNAGAAVGFSTTVPFGCATFDVLNQASGHGFIWTATGGMQDLGGSLFRWMAIASRRLGPSVTRERLRAFPRRSLIS